MNNLDKIGDCWKEPVLKIKITYSSIMSRKSHHHWNNISQDKVLFIGRGLTVTLFFNATELMGINILSLLNRMVKAILFQYKKGDKLQCQSITTYIIWLLTLCR